MKVNRELIQIGRTIGVENIGQMKKFVRQLVKKGKGSLHLEMNVNDAIQIARRADQANQAAILMGAPSSYEMVGLSRAHFPQLFAKGNRSIVDVVAQRVGESGGVLKATNRVVSSASKKLAASSVKVGGNSNGFFVNANSAIEDVSAHIKAIVVPKSTSGASRLALAKNVTVSSENGISQMSLAPTRTFGVKADAHVQAPTYFIDDLLTTITRGEIKSFADVMKLIHK